MKSGGKGRKKHISINLDKDKGSLEKYKSQCLNLKENMIRSTLPIKTSLKSPTTKCKKFENPPPKMQQKLKST